MSQVVIANGGHGTALPDRTTSQVEPRLSETADSARRQQTLTTLAPTSASSDQNGNASEVEKLRQLKQQIMDSQVPFFLSGAASVQALEALYVPHGSALPSTTRTQNSIEPVEAVRQTFDATTSQSQVADPMPGSGAPEVLDTLVQRESQEPNPAAHKASEYAPFSAAVGTITPQPLTVSTLPFQPVDAMDVDLVDIKPVIIHDSSDRYPTPSHLEPETKDPQELPDIKQALPPLTDAGENLIGQSQHDDHEHPAPFASEAQLSPIDDVKPSIQLANGSGVSSVSSQDRGGTRRTSEAASRRSNEDEWDSRYTRPPDIALRAREALLRSSHSRPRQREDTPVESNRDRRPSEVQDSPRKISPRPRSPQPLIRRPVSPPSREIHDYRMRDRGPSDTGLPARPHDVYRPQDPRDRSAPIPRPHDINLRRSPENDLPPIRMSSNEPRQQSPPRSRPIPRENNYRPVSPPSRSAERERFQENNYRPVSPPPRFAEREPYRGPSRRDYDDYRRQSLTDSNEDHFPERGRPRTGYNDYRNRSPTTHEYPSNRLAPAPNQDAKSGQYDSPHMDTARTNLSASAPSLSTIRTDSSLSYSRTHAQPEASRAITDSQRLARGRPKAGELNDTYSPLPSNDSLPSRPTGAFDAGLQSGRSISASHGRGPSPAAEIGRSWSATSTSRVPIPLANRISGILSSVSTDYPPRVTDAANGKNSNVSPPYSNPSSEDAIMVQKLLNDTSASETTATSSLRSPPKATTSGTAPPTSNAPNRQDSYHNRASSLSYGTKDYSASATKQAHPVTLPSTRGNHQADSCDRGMPPDYYRASSATREDSQVRYDPPSRYPDSGSDVPRDTPRQGSRDDWVSLPPLRQEWERRHASDDRGSRLDDRRNSAPIVATLPYSRRRSPSPVPLSRRLSPPRLIKEPQGAYRDPYPYPDDRRPGALKRPREDGYEMDTRRMPPPGWQDRDTYERGYPPPPSPNDSRLPYPYPMDHRDAARYRDRSPPPLPIGDRAVYERYSERGYGRPISPEFSSAGWYDGQRDQTYRR
ncbi:hypothetical protein FRB95_008437 [Tulasnella sp. JGI-2019a]|nr:hypothetical protein FRB95_008437 [Tulasnella sp. JGI-2019a]